MKLVIAEKPSVAQSLAAVLGAKERGQGYLQGNGYVVSWCVGHLIGLVAADAYDARYSKWCYEDLPIIPEKWKYTVAPDKKDQYEVLVSLINRPDVESLVCATDAGREGELIFRLVYDHAGCTKPFERLWISSMEDSAIREGFENLRPGTDYDLLYQAALCRAKADWLVGISGTRLFSTLYRKTLNIGRVMTPTLALVVDRETAISNFKKEKFYTVVLDCGKFTAASERCENRKAADHLSAACSTQAAVVQSVEKKQKSTQPPKLYDLTSLQRDGNRLFGYTAQQVLDYAQALYEKKLLTYHAPVMERLAKAFGIPEGGDLGECLMEAASKVAEEHYGEYLRDLHYEVEDSFLEGMDDHNIEVIFRDTIKASVQYAVLTRCGLDASLYIDADDLRGITNFNNVGTLACLGTATAEANRTILMEIGEAVKNIQLEQIRQAKKSLAKQPDVSYNEDEQFNTLKRERSGKDERIDIHQPERLSDSEHRDGQQGERTGNPDPVRQGEGEISDGTPESGLHGDAAERNPVGTSDGDRPGGEPAGRERNGGTGDERGRDGGTESSQSDGMGTADEQHPAESRGDRDGRPDLQLNTDTRTAGGEPAVLSSVEMDGPYSDASPSFTQMSLFPTVEEQIEQIAQSQAEASAPAFSVGMVPEQAVERILSAGTNEPAGALRIYAQYQAGAPTGEMAVSLRKEFGTGGRGFTIGGAPYAVWFDENGFSINSGKSARYDKESLRLSWTEVESRIRRLVETGKYLSAKQAGQVKGNEFKELAAQLWYLRQDFGDGAKEAGLLPTVDGIYMQRGGFPEDTAKLEKLLQSPEQLAAVVKEMENFCDAYQENREILRFHFHRPNAILHRLEQAQIPVKVFPLDGQFKEERPTFITEDEINEVLAPGGSYSDSKLAVYVFFQNHTDRKERQDYLKEAFGTGGGGSSIRDTWHDAKGMRIKRSYGEPYAETSLNWNQAERRIHQLMESGRFLTPDDQARFPEYERFILSRDVDSFFHYAAKEQRPYQVEGFFDGWKQVRPMLDNPAQVDGLLSVMKDGLQSLTPKQYGYEVCTRAYGNGSPYQRGTAQK